MSAGGRGLDCSRIASPGGLNFAVGLPYKQHTRCMDTQWGEKDRVTSLTGKDARRPRSFRSCQGLFGLDVLVFVYAIEPVNQGVNPVSQGVKPRSPINAG